MGNFDLIDWRLVGFGALWVLGAAAALAALGFAYDEAGRTRTPTRAVLAQRGYQSVLQAGGLLFAVGQAGLAASPWLAAAWLVVGAAFGWLAWRSYTSR
jgi:hypothetical protein